MYHSQGHGSKTSSSRSSASLAESGTSPQARNMDSGDDLWKDHVELTAVITENLQHKESFQKTRIYLAPSSNVRSVGLTKEHQKQGSVKMEVYNPYVYAASKVGIILFMLTISGQARVLNTVAGRSRHDKMEITVFFGTLNILKTV